MYLFVRHRVMDFTRWKNAFDEGRMERLRAGMTSEQLFRSEDDLNDVLILHGWDSSERARKFVHAADLQEKIEMAGVMGMPEIVFLDEVVEPRRMSGQKSAEAATA